MAGFYSVDPVAFESVSAVTATPSTELGARLLRDGLEYVYVYNDGNSNILVGDGCVTNVGTSSAYSVTVSAATSADLVIGTPRHATISTSSYGWVVVKGVTSINMKAASGTVLTGGLVSIGANGKWDPVSNTTGNLAAAIGKALNTIVTSASGSAFISCLG